jgi:hypothetical protein
MDSRDKSKHFAARIFCYIQQARTQKNDALFLLSMLVKKYIWDCKQRFTLPQIEHAKSFVREEVKIMCFCSKEVKKIFLNADLKRYCDEKFEG